MLSSGFGGSFLIAEPETGARLDVFAAERAALSRSMAQKLVESGNVSVNGLPAKSNYRLRLGDAVQVSVPHAAEPQILPEEIPLSIIYEDAHIIVIDKPKGMVVHPAPGQYSATLVNALLHHCRGSLSGIGGIMRPGIVHRIDKDTSGLLVATKNDRAHKLLADGFAARSVAREYHAIVRGGFDAESGTIDAPIARHPKERKKMAVVAGGRPAITHWRVLRPLNKFTLIAATLQTGRTHQIRVHMAHIRRPVLGDTAYGSQKQPFETNGQVLHACLLGFAHPATGQYMEFTSPQPEYFRKAMVRAENI